MGIGLNKPKDEPGKAWPAIVVGLFVAFGGVLFGYDTGLNKRYPGHELLDPGVQDWR